MDEVYDQVSTISKNNSIDTEYAQIIKRLRERTFKTIFEHTQSSDIAAYLSDDIALLLEAIVCNYNNSWLNGLWKKYSEGENIMRIIAATDSDFDYIRRHDHHTFYNPM
ncbi:hypothetical protein D3C73_997000 [compost metagenome]